MAWTMKSYASARTLHSECPYKRFRRVARVVPRASVELPVRKKPQTEYPHIFGMGKRDRVLMTLAVNRPLYVNELAVAIGSEEKKTAKMVHALLEVGVILRTDAPHGARYVALNTAFPAYWELFRLLNVLEFHWPQQRLGKPARRAERKALHDAVFMADEGPFPAKRYDRLFGSPVRTRVLLAIAAIEDTDVTDLWRLLGADKRSVWNTVNHLQREGLIRSTIKGRRRAIELNPQYVAARELRQLLKRLIRETEYSVFAKFSSRNPNSPYLVATR